MRDIDPNSPENIEATKQIEREKFALKMQAKEDAENLVGRLGEFTDSHGRICRCRVVDVEVDGSELLIISYYNQDVQRVILKAVIGLSDFRPDAL